MAAASPVVFFNDSDASILSKSRVFIIPDFLFEAFNYFFEFHAVFILKDRSCNSPCFRSFPQKEQISRLARYPVTDKEVWSPRLCH